MVDEPSLSVQIGINTSPLAGLEGKKLTARQILDRLDAELVGNVSIRVNDIDRPDAWEVQGRGELQLVVLLEMMRREGFELTAGQPQVVTHEEDGKLHEPVERLSIDAPEEHVGAVTQLLASRKGRMEQMVNHSTGWVRMEFLVPARGLIGFRTEFLTETRGTGIMNHVFDRWEPWFGELRTRASGSIVADRRGKTAGYSLAGLQDRGTLFVGPGEEVYEGMIVGENARSEDMDVNAIKEKQQTNMRAAGAEVLERLEPPTRLTLEASLEFLREDECVEITPESVRLRKVELDKTNARRRRGQRLRPSSDSLWRVVVGGLALAARVDRNVLVLPDQLVEAPLRDRLELHLEPALCIEGVGGVGVAIVGAVEADRAGPVGALEGAVRARVEGAARNPRIVVAGAFDEIELSVAFGPVDAGVPRAGRRGYGELAFGQPEADVVDQLARARLFATGFAPSVERKVVVPLSSQSCSSPSTPSWIP